MTKIPVGATIAQAYRFAFGNFLTLASVVWLPWAIMAAGGFLLLHQSMTLSSAMAMHDLSNIRSVLVLLLPFYVVMMVLLCMQMVGITQQVLGLRQGSPYYYFSLGKPLWRVIGAFLLVILLIIVGYVLLILLGVLLAFLVKLAHLSGFAAALSGIAGVVGFVVGFCAYIYALVRLTFLLVPVAVAENRIGLKRSWQLGRGNFWRMFAILLSILIPAIIFDLIFIFGFLFHGLPPFMPMNATPEQVAAFQAAMATWNADMMGRMMGYWYITYPLFALFTILFYGLSAGAQSFAYRAQTADEPLPAILDHP